MKRSRGMGVRAMRSVAAGIAMVLGLGVCDLSAALASVPADEAAFAQGSGVNIGPLNANQVDNLVLLGQVWGFLKYHHPAVAAGQRNWDAELFLQVPIVLSARDTPEAATALLHWIDALGPVAPCAPCASDGGADVQMRATLGWLKDAARLTPPLSERLQAIYRKRSSRQSYVQLAPNVGNPVFDAEAKYEKVSLSDAGFRLLSVYRFWNIIAYWFPYRDVIGEDWQQALRLAIQDAVMAPDDTTYQRELMALIARVHDTHANLWSSIAMRPPAGDCKVAAQLRFINDSLVVAATAPQSPLEAGDELLAVDGKNVPALVQAWRPYFAASNDAAMRRDMAAVATRGPCQDANLVVRRDKVDRTVSVERVAPRSYPAARTHDRHGDTFQMLGTDVAYLKLSSVKQADLEKYIAAAAGSKGLVVDIRNYPSEFVALKLPALLVRKKTPFVSFTRADLANPGLFRWSEPFAVMPAQPHYAGKVVVLVDEISQSQAEYTAMALRAVPGAVVVGSMTAGADGNASHIVLPGGLRTMISGIGVFYPDRKPTQRVGIVPDIEVRPTAAGLRAGTDEVLEAGLRVIRGN